MKLINKQLVSIRQKCYRSAHAQTRQHIVNNGYGLVTEVSKKTITATLALLLNEI